MINMYLCISGFEQVSDDEIEGHPRRNKSTSSLSGQAVSARQLAGKRRSGSGSSAAPSIVPLVIHLPYDHLRDVTIAASSDWTLAEVFSRVSAKLSCNAAHQQATRYVFFSWEDGKHGPRRVPHSPLVEYDLFGRHSKSSHKTANGAVGDGDGDVDGDDDLDDADEIDESSTDRGTSKAATGGAQSQPSSTTPPQTATKPPKSSKKKTSSLFSAFYQSSSSSTSSATQSSSPGIAGGIAAAAAAASSTSATSRGSDLLPPHMAFNMLASCSKSAIPMVSRGVER